MIKVIRAGEVGRCPHCGVTSRFEEGHEQLPSGSFVESAEGNRGSEFSLRSARCPACSKIVVSLVEYEWFEGYVPEEAEPISVRLIWPAVANRAPIPPDVPIEIRDDYVEAALVLPFSEKASAALSRRCLQALLREAGKAKKRDLARQIDEVLPTLPGYLQRQLDAVRHIGNFAAHPQKSRSNGEIVDVERGEAEWNLEVLELLFDFYYVQPKIAQEKREALNRKLADIGKPPMK